MRKGQVTRHRRWRHFTNRVWQCYGIHICIKQQPEIMGLLRKAEELPNNARQITFQGHSMIVIVKNKMPVTCLTPEEYEGAKANGRHRQKD